MTSPQMTSLNYPPFVQQYQQQYQPQPTGYPNQDPMNMGPQHQAGPPPPYSAQGMPPQGYGGYAPPGPYPSGYYPSQTPATYVVPDAFDAGARFDGVAQPTVPVVILYFSIRLSKQSFLISLPHQEYFLMLLRYIFF